MAHCQLGNPGHRVTHTGCTVRSRQKQAKFLVPRVMIFPLTSCRPIFCSTSAVLIFFGIWPLLEHGTDDFLQCIKFEMLLVASSSRNMRKLGGTDTGRMNRALLDRMVQHMAVT